MKYSSYLADSGFCGDRNMASGAGLWYSTDTALGYGENVTYYGAYNRLVKEYQPQFSCPQSNDLYTTSSSNKGNKALDYPIGLITIDEVAYAGDVVDKNNSNYYLYINGYYWTISPYVYVSSSAHVWYAFAPSNNAEIVGVYFGYPVRPVINLKSTIEIVEGGTGTQDNPYVIL